MFWYPSFLADLWKVPNVYSVQCNFVEKQIHSILGNARDTIRSTTNIMLKRKTLSFCTCFEKENSAKFIRESILAGLLKAENIPSLPPLSVQKKNLRL